MVLLMAFAAAMADASCPPLVCRCSSADAADCSGSGLTVLPAGLSTGVRSLDLSANRLADINVTELLVSLPALESLDLSNNGLSGFGAGMVTINHGLRHLSLSGNNITSVKRGLKLRGLATLQSLDLSGNRY